MLKFRILFILFIFSCADNALNFSIVEIDKLVLYSTYSKIIPQFTVNEKYLQSLEPIIVKDSLIINDILSRIDKLEKLHDYKLAQDELYQLIGICNFYSRGKGIIEMEYNHRFLKVNNSYYKNSIELVDALDRVIIGEDFK